MVVFALMLLASFGVAQSRMAYKLSAGVEFGLPQRFVRTFSCSDYDFGFYADVDNNCELYHVCMPVYDDLNQLTETAHFSFACGAKTIFSQEALTCTFPREASPCEQAESIYESSNKDSGLFNRKHNDTLEEFPPHGAFAK